MHILNNNTESRPKKTWRQPSNHRVLSRTRMCRHGRPNKGNAEMWPGYNNNSNSHTKKHALCDRRRRRGDDTHLSIDDDDDDDDALVLFSSRVRAWARDVHHDVDGVALGLGRPAAAASAAAAM